MKLKIKRLKFLAGRPVSMIHQNTAKKMSLHVGDRISIKNKKGKKLISIIDIISGFLKEEEVAISEEIRKILSLKNKEYVDVKIVEPPHSMILIKKKLEGGKLNKKEIYEIIEDIKNNALTEIEIAFFVSAICTNFMSLKETKNLTKAIIKSGKRIKLKGKIADKHCIGGIAGNRTTPIIVSICSSAGLIIPKTSSRAITSAAGTADVIETVSRVNFSIKEIKKIIKKTKACLVWGGTLGLAPVDDKILKIERIANLDSTAQLLASILSKKIAVGSKYVLIDIPYGKSAKVTKIQAEKLRLKFLKLGKAFNLKLAVILTNGSEPIGNGIGPVLEMKDILKVLKRDCPPKDLENKSLFLSAKLLELCGKSKKGKGIEYARKILDSGQAFIKFKEIIKAQGGSIKNLQKPKISYNIISEKNKKIKHIDNKMINNLARILGCPEDKAAGIYIHKKKNNFAKKGEKIFTLYALSNEKLNHAKRFYKKNQKQIIEFR